MKQNKKIGIIAFLTVILIVASMIYATSILKEESEFNHLHNTELHINSFNEEIMQIALTVNRGIDNISLVLNDKRLLSKRMDALLFENPFMRSITILDTNNKVIDSTNIDNLGHILDTKDYYPKPFFTTNVLQFGQVVYGRDLLFIEKTLNSKGKMQKYF